jgi:DNA-binding response OmpR family regulator
VNLELEGFDVLDTGDGAQAVELARQEHPDVIFLDLLMPGIDGWEVLRRLKEDDGTARIPVVLLTARTGDDDQLRGWEEGILDYVAKPFNPLLLAERATRARQAAEGHGADADAAEEHRRLILDRLERRPGS